jgi:hypothetical protein
MMAFDYVQILLRCNCSSEEGCGEMLKVCWKEHGRILLIHESTAFLYRLLDYYVCLLTPSCHSYSIQLLC